jgi:hypothetical protein
MKYFRSDEGCARGGAQSAHAATIDKAEHAFAATGIYPYRPNIISDEDFEPSEVTRKDKMPNENLEGTEHYQSFTVICRKPHVTRLNLFARHNFSKPGRDFVDTLYY